MDVTAFIGRENSIHHVDLVVGDLYQLVRGHPLYGQHKLMFSKAQLVDFVHSNSHNLSYEYVFRTYTSNPDWQLENTGFLHVLDFNIGRKVSVRYLG